jgi:glycosyltransferase involved in cell wall biosynthesis
VISLIVPCWKDEEHAIEFAEKWANHPLIREVVVAAVRDQSQLQQPNGKIKRCQSDRPGRGLQLNLGAKIATGEVLLFHHVDSILTEEHLQSVVNSMRNRDLVGGAFYRKFDGRHPHLRWLEKFERWHCRAFGTIYGDQSVFVRRNHFWSIGGFAPIPLMEDVELSGRLRRSGQIKLLDPPMESSARKQIERGPWSVTMRNLLFLILFRCGIAAERLHEWYYGRDGAAVPR